MNILYNYFIGNTGANYVEVGFSDREGQAMAWLAEQKPKGKFYGTLVGAFMAFSWGHWHDRIFSHFGLKCKRLYTQLAILGVTIKLLRSSSSLETT